MTLLNWIGIGLTAVILIVGIILRIRWRKKVKDLDGFCGIVKKDDISKTPK